MALREARIEPLATGQRMDVEEFVRRWDALPDLKNAELIDGVVYVASPLGPDHGEQDFRLHVWLGYYADGTPGVCGLANTSCRLAGSMPQTDVCLRIHPDHGGGTATGRAWLEGTPDSSVARDLGPKKALYQRAQVPEYLTYEIASGRLTWRSLGRDGSYRNIRPQPDGSLRSRVFPGLWIDPVALAEGRSLLTMVRKGMRSPEYREFRKLLRGRRQRKGEA
ncbi:MAG: Uma2 family endonuclease [Acidobacteria bacterium]|nr:Uma2 family endonuclease [Acidobacteriota bacterium]